MEIGSSKSPLNTLANLTRNSQPKAVEPSVANQRVVDTRAQISDSVMYHASDEYILSSSNVSGNRVRIYQMLYEDGFTETKSEKLQRLGESFSMLNTGLADVSADLKRAYDDVAAIIPKELASKDWGFTVTETGEVSVIEGDDTLTAREKRDLQSILNEPELKARAGDFAELVIKALELDRGGGKSTWGIGKYDLTHANFKDTIDIKAFLDAPITGKYADRYGTLTYKNDFRSLYWGMRGELESQLAARSEIKYTPKSIEIFADR